jgi:glycosyltransferase involved in cell wall biosynthesis
MPVEEYKSDHHMPEVWVDSGGTTVPQPVICYVTEYYPPFGAGGAERTAALHAEILVKAGYSVSVITPNYGAEPREFINGIEVIRFPFYKRLHVPGEQVNPWVLSNPYHYLYLARQIVKILRNRSVKCIHAQNSRSVVGAYLAARWLSVPLVTHLRDAAGICGMGATCLLDAETVNPPPSCSALQNMRCYLQRNVPLYAPNLPVTRRLGGLALSVIPNYFNLLCRRRAYRASDRIAFASHGLKRLYQHINGFDAESKHKVVYAPVVEEGEMQHSQLIKDLPREVQELKELGKKIILYVGKISKGKGCDVLFEAHRRLVERMPEAHLVVAGNVNKAAWVYDRERTLFLEFVERSRVKALFCACDLVVVPSIWPEPLGWSTLDAAQNGKPIVATRVGGIPEVVIHGVTGLLVDRLDVTGLENAMHELVSDEDRMQEMGRRAHDLVFQKFGKHAVKSQLEDLYSDL